MIVVDDMESIPPRNRLLILENPNILPAANPATIIPHTINNAVTTAEPPALTSFRKLNSSPNEKSRTIIPI